VNVDMEIVPAGSRVIEQNHLRELSGTLESEKEICSSICMKAFVKHQIKVSKSIASRITPTSIIYHAPFEALPLKYGNDSTCSICTDDYQHSSYVLILPCQHHAHADCLLIWLYKNDTCHICRATVRS
jgi:hypothetical protein